MNGLMESTSSYNAEKLALYEEVFDLQRNHLNKTRKYRSINRFQENLINRKTYKDGLYSFLLWWGIGTGIGFLFATAVDSEMKQSLAAHLQEGVTYLAEHKNSTFTYFLKRCLCYTNVFMLVWCLEYFSFGYVGVRILMLSRGFIFGFSQTAWIISYGIKGVFLGVTSYLFHNLFLFMGVAWLEYILRKNTMDHIRNMRRIGVLIGGMVLIIAWVEVYVSKTVFLTCV